MTRLAAIVALVWGCSFVGGTARAAAPCGAPANITMSPLSPGVVTADGASRATAVVTLTDIAGNPVVESPACLQPTASDPGVRFGPITDNLDGTYSVPVVSSTTAGQIVVTVTESTSGISASEPLTQVHGPAHTVVLALASGALVANGLSRTAARVSVSDAHGNPVTGDAIVLQASDPGVRFGPVTDQGNGVYSATLFGSNTPGADTVRATDISVSPSPWGTTSLTEFPAPSLLGVATMQWTFFYTRVYTVVRSLVVNGAPAGSTINMACAGRGCPFSAWTLKAGKQPRCSRRFHRPCQSGSSLVLTPGLARRRLQLGARITVAIVRPGWIGKYYRFRVRSAAGPAIQINCLAPGSTRPGAGC